MLNIRINKPFGQYTVGQVVKVAVDGSGTPLDQYWRRRLKDAGLDGCCEVVETNPKPSRKSRRGSQAEEE